MEIQTGSIYIIKNKINDKVYIGQTTMPVRERFLQHMKPSTIKKRRSYKFYDAVIKYGKENFFVETLECDIPIDRLDEKEIFILKNTIVVIMDITQLMVAMLEKYMKRRI